MEAQLQKLYIDQRLSLQKTAIIFGVSVTTIYRWLIKYGIRVRNSGELNIGRPSGATGKTWKLSKQAKLNHSLSLKGKPKSIEHRINMGKVRKGLFAGDKNPNWQGGVDKSNNKLRQSMDYVLWREAVKRRDDYTCIFCGQTEGEIHADHIKPFAYYPELRFETSNGRTLCKDCHIKTPTWGVKGRVSNVR